MPPIAAGSLPGLQRRLPPGKVMLHDEKRGNKRRPDEFLSQIRRRNACQVQQPFISGHKRGRGIKSCGNDDGVGELEPAGEPDLDDAFDQAKLSPVQPYHVHARKELGEAESVFVRKIRESQEFDLARDGNANPLSLAQAVQ